MRFSKDPRAEKHFKQGAYADRQQSAQLMAERTAYFYTVKSEFLRKQSTSLSSIIEFLTFRIPADYTLTSFGPHRPSLRPNCS